MDIEVFNNAAVIAAIVRTVIVSIPQHNRATTLVVYSDAVLAVVSHAQSPILRKGQQIFQSDVRRVKCGDWAVVEHVLPDGRVGVWQQHSLERTASIEQPIGEVKESEAATVIQTHHVLQPSSLSISKPFADQPFCGDGGSLNLIYFHAAIFHDELQTICIWWWCVRRSTRRIAGATWVI